MRPIRYGLSAAVCCALTLTFFGTALPAFAAEDTPRIKNGMTYELTENDTRGTVVRITGYTAELPRELVIPAELGGYPVLEIQAGAFQNAPLDTVVIAEGITDALPNAFSGSTLREITLPKSLSYIETGLCSGCADLTALHIAEGITEIGDSAFRNCSALTALELPDSITVLGNGAFAGCNALTEVTLGENVKEVGAQVLNRCKDLRSVTFLNPDCRISQVPGTVSNGSDAQMIPYYYGLICGFQGSTAEQFAQNAGVAFSGPGALQAIPGSGAMASGTYTYELLSDGTARLTAFNSRGEFYIPSAVDGIPVTELGDGLYDGIGNVTEITVPEGIRIIGNHTFSRMFDLKSVTLPESLVSIGDSAFSATRLEKIVIPENVRYIGKAAFTCCNGLRSVTLPEGLTAIHDKTFYVTSLLREINLPESLVYIGERTFSCVAGIRALKLPASVSYIGEDAFCGCYNLMDITIPHPDCVIFDSSSTLHNQFSGNIFFSGCIHGYAGSAAEQYAEKYGYAFSASGARARGDLNGDGTVTLDDAQNALAAYTAAISELPASLSAEAISAADADLDGDLTLRDAQLILNYYVMITLTSADAGWNNIITEMS